MLLETLDIKNNDIVIFSQNQFDLENNFKIIFKDDPEKKVRKLHYKEVCRFVNEFSPKNMIIYRLLTNIRHFEIKLTKYGFPIYINGSQELMYFDPAFALQELKEYQEKNLEDLRFRIQQVGLTTLNRFNNLPNFAELYSVDLQASEAKNQNDRVFADAIFLKSHVPVLNKQNIKVINNELAEDNQFDYKEIRRMNFRGEQTAQKNDEASLRKFIEAKNKNASSGIFNQIEAKPDREDQKVILKIKKN